MERPKVFGIGFQKTGTSSLQEALEILGYSSCGTRPDLLLDILRSKYRKVRRTVSKFDAFSDHPWPQIYPWLNQQFPASKFILTKRNEEEWFTSVSHHIGDFIAPIHEWIYGRGKGLPKHNKENTIEVFRKHEAEVIAYFSGRPESLLIVNVPQDLNWETLCSFLNCPIPNTPFPHLNKSKYNSPRNYRKRMGTVKYYRRIIKNAFILRYLKWRKYI